MNLRKIALGLFFGGALAVGSMACDDSSSGSGDTGVDLSSLPQACPGYLTDGDSASTNFAVINTLTLPAADGFNIDGLNNAATNMGGRGKTIPGCSVQDLAGGKDNALATLAVTLKQAGLDLNKDLTNTLMAAGQGGTLVIEARLTHLSAANVADDACIGAEVRVGGAGGPVFDGSGSLTAHVASIKFSENLAFDAAVNVPDSSCNGGACNDGAKLSITIDSPIATIKLDATNDHIQAGSLIGGFIFYEDLSAPYASLNATGFQTSLSNFFTAVNLSDDLRGTALSTFSGAQDLHMNVDRSIGVCTSPNGSASAVTKNSVSVALAITSL